MCLYYFKLPWNQIRLLPAILTAWLTYWNGSTQGQTRQEGEFQATKPPVEESKSLAIPQPVLSSSCCPCYHSFATAAPGSMGRRERLGQEALVWKGSTGGGEKRKNKKRKKNRTMAGEQVHKELYMLAIPSCHQSGCDCKLGIRQISMHNFQRNHSRAA